MKKAIFHFLIIVVAFNGISGICAVDYDASASWQTALTAESSVFSFLLTAAVPSSIINKLVPEKFPLCIQLSKTLPTNEPRKEKTNHSRNQTFGIFTEDPVVRRYSPVTAAPFSWLQNSLEDRSYYCSVERAVAPAVTFIFFLLAYLVILSRVHLPWDKNLNNSFLKPSPSIRTGFHLLRRLP